MQGNAKLFLFPLVVSATVAYTHFFGYSYLKGKLHGAGFSNPEIDISVQESVLQTANGLIQILSRIIHNDHLLWFILKESLAIGSLVAAWVAVISLVLRPLLFFHRKLLDIKLPIGQSIKDQTLDNLVTIKNTALVSTTAFFASTLSVVFGILTFIAGLSAIWFIMHFGYIIGQFVGNELTEDLVCDVRDWGEQENRRLGCDVINTKDGSSITGLRVYKSKQTIYFLANAGAYELNTEGKILHFRPIHTRSNQSKE